ncbi:MAG TPA: hypothetical protein DCS07_04585 [Bdellovibrionales bacterium]|nr:MAG: hypothetical protein A2Z97_07875 [Bdellovibrionales bacterium GWB1_52_6]OFZ04793.1 MAG: hypothetical protein A2X97_13815 [Bdellovibrionales bacterium GWA1_52_35]OFZ42815.1 MAG: hypothetical protein A2070_05695 [Bdellovibrionales bacterium GWC1_52_8]HAR41897.1 hypothetical protein [Bdellovibrionales bacterium]HCM39612.1 hypothetical protein [Bdellovibrionales bacterium]
MLNAAGAKNPVNSANSAVNSADFASAGVAMNTGAAIRAADKETSTAPKFGEIYQELQAKYGAKSEKPREIKKTLGKDDFLKIMITQMRHQDPTSPFKPDQMAAQMAQFASVEQLQNINQNIGKMTQQNSPLERLAMTNMIGKVVTVDRERFPHTENTSEALSFVLPKNASAVNVTVVAENGEAVFGKELGSLKAGENSVAWDGNKTNTLPAKAGTYTLHIEAKDENGQSIDCSRQSQSRIVGVSFEGAEPVFLIGDARKQEKITLKNIVRVESDGAGPAPSIPQNAAVPQANAAPNFFTFQKGVGSTGLDPAQASPEVRSALARYQQQAPANQPAAGAIDPARAEEKGFPNGLQDNDEAPRGEVNQDE